MTNLMTIGSVIGAAKGGHIDVLEYLKSVDASVLNAHPLDTDSPLSNAAASNKVEVLRWLMNNGGQFSPDGMELLKASYESSKLKFTFIVLICVQIHSFD